MVKATPSHTIKCEAFPINIIFVIAFIEAIISWFMAWKMQWQQGYLSAATTFLLTFVVLVLPLAALLVWRLSLKILIYDNYLDYRRLFTRRRIKADNITGYKDIIIPRSGELTEIIYQNNKKFRLNLSDTAPQDREKIYDFLNKSMDSNGSKGPRQRYDKNDVTIYFPEISPKKDSQYGRNSHILPKKEATIKEKI